MAFPLRPLAHLSRPPRLLHEPGALRGAFRPLGLPQLPPAPRAPYLKAFAQSLLLGALTTLLAALLGYPLAFYLAGHPRRDLLLLLLLLPFFTNFLIRVYAWLVLLQRKAW